MKPYVTVRGNLEALVSRPVFYDLVDVGVVEGKGKSALFGVRSAQRFWPMALAGEIGAEP